MANFSRRRRFFRLIGRLTVLETIVIYGFAIGINIYSLFEITDQQQMEFWYNIDSLILVSYAVILITVVLVQREKLMNYKNYFKFGELFNFGDDADPHEESRLDELSMRKSEMVRVQPIQHDVASSVVDRPEDQLEVHSAFGHDDILKLKMYQVEQRYKTSYRPDSKSDVHQRNNSQLNGGRAVSVIDYEEYRKLEDKRDRIMLKKNLYEQKKTNDESQVVLLNEELNQYQKVKDELEKQRKKLQD